MFHVSCFPYVRLGFDMYTFQRLMSLNAQDEYIIIIFFPIDILKDYLIHASLSLNEF